MRWFNPIKAKKFPVISTKHPFENFNCKQLTWILAASNGKLCKASVKVGDEIKTGDVIGDNGVEKVISPINGTVVGTEDAAYPPSLRSVPAIQVKVAPGAKYHKALDPVEDAATKDYRLLFKKIEQASTSYVILQSAIDDLYVDDTETIDALIINGCDQDYMLCSRIQRSRKCLENLDKHAAVLKNLTGAKKVLLAVPEPSVAEFQEKLANSVDVEVFGVPDEYPYCLDSMVGRIATKQGVGENLRVVSIHIALAVGRLLVLGNLPTFIFLTVVDRDKKPRNIRVLNGTTAGAILSKMGVYIKPGDRVLLGGALTGNALYELDTPVVSGTEGITVIAAQKTDQYIPRPCINCGECISICPVNLQPHMMGRYSEYKRYSEVENLKFCISCGLCTYVCPSMRPLGQWFDLARKALRQSDENQVA